ncbi:hypothetical protein N574_0116350 [Lactiplantibacillus plantarum 2165]|nr:hypothetical protein N574_0116350 [Lactiplantibacillus plantarum 2165]
MITSEKTTKPAAWKGFKGGHWQEEINIRDFIQNNFTQYNGDESFLAGPTAATKTLNDKVLELKKQERAAGGVLDADTKVVATITSHGPGYIQKDLEKIVGLQTDKPLKRAFMPFGGIRMADDALKSYGYTLMKKTTRFSLNIARLITKASSMFILLTCGKHVTTRSSPDYQMHTHVAVSFLIFHGSLFMGSIV